MNGAQDFIEPDRDGLSGMAVSKGEDGDLDPERLLVRLNSGKSLTSDEIEELVRCIELALSESGPLSLEDLYAMVLVLSRARLTDRAYLLERAFEVRDPLTVALALETLCLDWELYSSYVERVMAFALGVAWDPDGDVQGVALKILGEFLKDALSGKTALAVPTEKKGRGSSAAKPKRSSSEKPKSAASDPRIGAVLELLFSIFDDVDLEHGVRQAAYCSLLRAGGRDWELLPSECVEIDLSEGSEDLDGALLAKLRTSGASSLQ